MTTNSFPIICLMGPTASGKTKLALELTQYLPIDIISVDSAMVYRGMDIGTAKPTPAEQAIAPHRLLDILDPSETYSAGQFCTDARREIQNSIVQGRIPLLVGGTMLYFKALQFGLSDLPIADLQLRQRLEAEGKEYGWQYMYQKLAAIDPIAAKRINAHDKQRIQRALEIYELTGHTLTALCQESPLLKLSQPVLNIALLPSDRILLHQQIQQRFEEMLKLGFIDEVKVLYQRGDLHPDLPSLRAVGYRQIWNYLERQSNLAEMQQQAIAATRQLAKRQITWLRRWPNLQIFDSQQNTLSQVINSIKPILEK